MSPVPVARRPVHGRWLTESAAEYEARLRAEAAQAEAARAKPPELVARSGRLPHETEGEYQARIRREVGEAASMAPGAKTPKRVTKPRAKRAPVAEAPVESTAAPPADEDPRQTGAEP